MTLIETLVSILIFSLGLIPLFLTISLSNRLGATIRNNLVASNLAREGVEVVRSIRDANWFNAISFDTNLADCGTADCDWRIQWDSTVPIALGTNPPLRFDAASGIYSYAGIGIDTQFTRKITISRVGACNCEIKIISAVTWPERGGNKTVTVESHLFDWK